MPILVEMSDGTQKEVPTDEELAVIKEETAKVITEKEELLEVKAVLEEKLAKLENKDYNFKKLREMTEEEKDKLTAMEMQLKQKQEELEENQNTFKTTLITSYKDEALAVLIGDDEKIKEKVLKNYDRIVGEAVTKEQVNQRMREAFNMLGIKGQSINPINSVFNTSGGTGNTATKAKLTTDQIDLAKKLGLKEEDLKN